MGSGGAFKQIILDTGLGKYIAALMVLATAAGSNTLSHLNDAAFWLFKGYFNLSIKDTFKTWGLLELTNSVVQLCMVLVLSIFIN